MTETYRFHAPTYPKQSGKTERLRRWIEQIPETFDGEPVFYYAYWHEPNVDGLLTWDVYGNPRNPARDRSRVVTRRRQRRNW